MRNWLSQHRSALGLALRRLAQAPVNTLLSVVAIGVALALPAGGLLLLGNAAQLARNAAPTPQISLFLALDADARAVTGVESALKAHGGVSEYRYIPREQTRQRMRSAEGLGDVIDALPENPFPDAFVVQPRDDSPAAMEALARNLATLPRVEHVQLDSAWVRRLDALLRLGRSGVALLALLLGVGLVAITFNTIRLQVLTQRAEIEVSRLLGATDAFIRRPFHWFGTLQGLAGGLLAWAMAQGAALMLRSPIAELAQLYSLNFMLSPLEVRESLVLLALAAVLGWLGAALSLRQYLLRGG
ncbi:permease-like cell division protein FtsX [Denitratisoma oestradiolicum]|uniref:Cell division protein FtsX n=1 Tax=Denitratisoma oestradiolicum TaxID=311182 RepID=A0A6S6XTM0_9PROT|nr:permease-like cell division protein FtsX [Denitratisoma oestradiolicum]TWO79747.1 cell division protein FtsX [Denitratisoma oestradiolicum]CAB1367513.1 Cell division protein FtsX [Denitratisoma oestradiolicum]